MKDKKKVIVPLLLAGVTATGVVSNIAVNTQTIVSAEETDIAQVEGAKVKVGRFKDKDLKYADTFKVGDKVYLPKVDAGTLDAGEEIVYTIKKDKKEFEPESDTNGKFFMAKYQGYYDVTIAVKKDGKVSTVLSNLSVFVERDDATIKLPTNSEYVIPAKMPKNIDGLKIPAVSVLVDENGKEVEKTVADLTANNAIAVYLVTPTSQEPVNLELDSTKSFYSVAKENLGTVGTYQIVYEYRNIDTSDNSYTVVSRLESNFQIVDDYDTSSVKLKMIFQSSMPTKANVKSDVSIPKVKVVDTNASSTDAINAYTVVTVRNLETNEPVDVDYTNYTFHPEKEGTYSVTYASYIGLFGAECKTGEVTPGEPIVVTDTEAPKVIPTYAYKFDAEGKEITEVNGKTVTEITGKTQREVAEEMLVNRRVDIPSVAVQNVEFEIPAAYATDNFFKFTTANADDIVITRTYRESTGAVKTVTEKANELGKIKFENSGNAEIRYKATDKKGNTLGEVVYDLVVYKSADEFKDGKTTVKLDVGTELVSDRDKTVTFAKPTATDTFDKNVDVQTILKVGETKYPMTEHENGYGTLFTIEDGKYVINVANVASLADEFTVIAKATVDKTMEGRINATETTVTRTVKIMRSNLDEHSPELSVVDGTWNNALFNANKATADDEGIISDRTGSKINDAGYLENASGKIEIGTSGKYKAPFDQGSSILKIPSVKFEDNIDSNLSISIQIKDRKGNVVSKVDQEYIERTGNATTGYEYVVSGASFKLSAYGMYTVTFTAKDYAGNMTIQSFGVRVNDKTAPTITIIDEDKFNKEIEVGEYFEVPTATLVKDGVTLDNGATRWQIYNTSANATFELYNNGFIPTNEGTFFIKYFGTDELGNEAELTDSMFTVTAKDTIAPTITLDMTERMPANIEWNPAEGTDYMTINIPVAFATDKNRGQVDVIYTITGPNNVKPTLTDHETKDYLKSFKATTEGKYTIVYSAVDEAGNESKVEKVINVGDCIDPKFTWINQEQDLPEEIKLNQTYELKVNDFLKLTDNKSTEAKLRENLTVTLTSPDGTTVTNLIGNNSGYKWEFTKTGNYTLKITVKDEVGNSYTKNYTIKVPSEDAETKKVSPVLGTVLIVLSVVVLAGVVVYFVASSKKKPGKKATPKKK